MNTLKKLCYLSAAVLLSASFVSCSSDDNEIIIEQQTPSQVLSSTPWETTGAKDKNGNNVALTDASVAGYVGYSYFKANGTFKIFGLNDILRSEGTWSISPDGKKRTLTTPTFTRVVDILLLNETTFTYRITPDAANPAVFYDIIHTKVNHKEPL